MLTSIYANNKKHERNFSMKKIASLLMALLLAAATFTACNNNGNETSNGDNSVASQPSSVSTAGESAVTSTEPDEPYTNGNGIYVTDLSATPSTTAITSSMQSKKRMKLLRRNTVSPLTLSRMTTSIQAFFLTSTAAHSFTT